ncbi:class I adenylate-forming enzyme family protein [Sphingomonas psychrolutea]|uniref:Acyl-CoA synthetase n=1 Tax=Sphingomonas psychrolutea TaxID=1259676 RepID=A0ABQ1GWS6_9SPHN|nr:AMP-binding protein [Sphingomonas psychrolutea]GGA51851.1 acyl-CoA synthetase [Sphingomonas psychrolutea]
MEADITLLDVLREHAARTPGKPCLSFGEETIGFAGLDVWSDRIATFLEQRGVGPGDRVAILSHNAPLFYALLFACAKISAIMVPLNWRLSAREIAAIIADGEPSVVLASDVLSHLLPVSSEPPVPLNLLDALPDVPARSGSPDPDAAAIILYTSGTTGEPKGAMLSHRALGYAARIAPYAWNFDGASVNLVGMPLFHIGGIGYGMMALTQGGHTVLTREADPALILATIDRWQVTHAFFVPTVIQRLVELVEAGAPPPRSLNLLVYGAAPIGETLLRRAIAVLGCGFSHAYGMTESAGTIVSLPASDHDPDGPNADRLRSCGRAFPWVEIALVDPTSGAAVPTGEIGEIRIRSAMLMSGYWRKPAETAAVIDREGWFHSGDAATRDADGCLFIRDRYKDMIVSGGENIYPAEIEHVLQAHPAVADVVVIGVPHSTWGETPRACVVGAPGEPADEAALIAFARERLARYKCPSSVRFMDAFPRNASGKVLKYELRAQAVAEEGL